MRFFYDNKTYNRYFGIAYTVLQLILGPFFIVLLTLLIIPNISITVPDALIPVVIVLVLLSLVGFPIITIIKHGYRRLAQKSYLEIIHGTLHYEQLKQSEWTAVGHVTEYYIYETTILSDITVTRRYYVLTGDFSESVVNNGRILKTDKVDTVKIPRAYKYMEKIREQIRGTIYE